jgi:predicted small secreted protein
MMRRWISFVVLAAVLAGCNTMAGLGRDVEKLGGKIEKKASK